MFTNEYFIKQSLGLNLFFLRILMEHSFFLAGSFTPAGASLAGQAAAFHKEFAGLLRETVSLADGLVCSDILSSGEIVTEFTLDAEKATELFTGATIDTDITIAELALTAGKQQTSTTITVQQVFDLNRRAITAAQNLVNFKTTVLNDVLACRLFTFNYPLMIDHIRRENIMYIDLLARLQQCVMAELAGFAVEQECFWNTIMGEHAKFIRGLLDPSEKALLETADCFDKKFTILTARARAPQKQIALLSQVTEESLKATEEIRDFKEQGTAGILACKIKSIILPLLSDHVLREANHYLRILKAICLALQMKPFDIEEK